MTLVDHLAELRDRLIRSCSSSRWGPRSGSTSRRRSSRLLVAPLPQPAAPGHGVGDAFFISVKIAIVFGIILAMPVILYQLWAFVAPGLTTASGAPCARGFRSRSLFFAMGVSIAYFVMPFAVQFLLSSRTTYFNP